MPSTGDPAAHEERLTALPWVAAQVLEGRGGSGPLFSGIYAIKVALEPVEVLQLAPRGIASTILGRLFGPRI